MIYSKKNLPAILLIVGGTLTGCGQSVDGQKTTKITIERAAKTVTQAAEPTASNREASSNLETGSDQLKAVEGAAAMVGAAKIPYPIYPNGSQYRTGGENGMNIILFQTDDSFEQVDAYYQAAAQMSRLSAMNDYVRYSSDTSDTDPWETGKPGIVIHRFNSEMERDAVGANDSATTNIIMSFKESN